MKRLNHDPEQFDVLRIYEAYARSKNISISDESTLHQFMIEVSDTIKKHLERATLIHGTHVQCMFAHIAAALGECSIINEEDSGLFYCSDTDIRRPDFRFLRSDGKSFFIEVKNFHSKDPFKSFNAKAKYIESLLKYTTKFNTPLKIAIYWSRWNIWTLIDIEYFDKEKSQYIISFPEAMKRNEMIAIGDRMIGTEFPLSLRLYTDPDKPRQFDNSGMAPFTVKKAVLLVCGKEITDNFEQKLAWFFMLYGRWENLEQNANVVNNELDYIDISLSPIQHDEKQNFAMIDTLSNMLSRQYITLTSPKGQFNSLIPQKQPDEMGVFIPSDYKWKVLRLWRVKLQPNYNDVIKNSS